MTDTNTKICVVCDNPHRQMLAQEFASLHSLPLREQKNKEYSLQLVFGEAIIELYDLQLDTSIHVDFTAGPLAHRQRYGGGRGQAIAKAIGIKKTYIPSVLDITAGLARDAYVIACLGCRITLIEQSAVLATLIRDGIERGLLSVDCASLLTDHFELHNMNAIEYMKNITDENRPDVIYIDPMYPERKKSALVKKDMQILQHLLGKDENAELLLETACVTAAKRVVVKRPTQAGHIGVQKPHTCISSKKTRYDVYTMNN